MEIRESVKELFLPVGLAKEVIENGFDQPFFGYHDQFLKEVEPFAVFETGPIFRKDFLADVEKTNALVKKQHPNAKGDMFANVVLLPMYQQVINWLITKDIDIAIVPIYDKGKLNGWKFLGLRCVSNREKVFVNNKENDLFEYKYRNEAYNEAIKQALTFIKK